MVIERSGFLLMAGTLAAGGVGGWFAHDAKTQHERPQFGETPAPALPSATAPALATAPAVPTALASERIPLPPACDDNIPAGALDECPAMGPADEGVCTNFAAKRCADFKAAFKPKVAQAAVACLKTLKGNAACDPARVNLCGHSALMAACPAAAPELSKPADSTGAVLGSALDTACENIIKGCAGQPLLPSTADCRQTLSGMTDFGRASMVECMATHCGDKGLLGCEATKKP